MKPSVVARKYAKQINRSRADSAVSRHKNLGHVGKEPADKQMPNPGTVSAIKEERHRKSVEDRIDELYKLSLAGCKMAVDEQNVRGLAACIAQGIAATALMGKPGSTEKDETESDGYIEAVRATARHDWKEARTVQVETSKSEAEDDSELVDA